MDTDDVRAADPGAEMAALRRTLDGVRRHVLAVIDGLDASALTSAALPSGWTPVQLVRHLTLSDERYWFHGIVGGEPLDWFPEGERADWIIPEGDTSAIVVDRYRSTVDESNRILDGVAVDDPPARRDPLWDEWGIDFPTIRSILLHVIVETATHAGHLDAAVELGDGRQFIVLD